MDFKVRVVEKMKDFQGVFGNTNLGSTGESLFRKYCNSGPNQLKASDNILNEAEMLDILKYMIANKDKNLDSFNKMMNSLNHDGYSFVHYLCYLRNQFDKSITH